MEQRVVGCGACTNYLEQMRQTIRLTGRLRDEHDAAATVRPVEDVPWLEKGLISRAGRVRAL